MNVFEKMVFREPFWTDLFSLPLAFWLLLRPLGASLGLLGTFLGALEASWAPLGASRGAFLEPLGASWGTLGAPLGRRPEKGQKTIPKMTHLGSQKSDQKRTKIEDKIEHRKSTSSRPSWERLGPILGRFRCPLEVTECTLPAVALVFSKNHFF